MGSIFRLTRFFQQQEQLSVAQFQLGLVEAADTIMVDCVISCSV
jgi:hypothetical protein